MSRFRFAASLLPPVGLSQMADDALLLSAAMHAPSGGVFVYQLRFELGRDKRGRAQARGFSGARLGKEESRSCTKAKCTFAWSCGRLRLGCVPAALHRDRIAG